MSQLLTTGSKLGVVIIGRNEGQRLATCIGSIRAPAAHVVYVDSGSTDDSVRLATALGSYVVELDPKDPFTAARARNDGFKHILRMVPDLDYVQFLDGDCEVVAGWLERATAFLNSRPDVAVVCGRRRERRPAQSVYNMLCDMEWDTPLGETKACGGDAMVRVEAFEQVGGFRADLIAGEEPELCVRLRASGWRIWRIDSEMTLHDAAMTHFSQWWRRALRSGYAFAEGAYLHGAPPERHWVWESKRAWLWGVWLPIACLAATVGLTPWGWILWLIYPVQVLRQTLRNPGPFSQRVTLALFQVLSRFPEGLAQLLFMRDRWRGNHARLIEYK